MRTPRGQSRPERGGGSDRTPRRGWTRTRARRIGVGASGRSHSRSKSGSHVCSVRGRLRRAWNTARVPRRLVLVTFPLALCAGIGDAGICMVYDSWIVPDLADTSVNVVIRSSGSVDSPLRTGVLNYHDLGGRHTPPAAGARPVVRDARRGGSRGGTLPSRSGSTPFAELVARPSDGHTRGLRLHLRRGQTAVSPS